MVTAGAGRAAGPPAGHVDLMDGVEAGRGVTDEHARQAGRERRSHHDRQGPLPGLGVEGQEPADLGRVVADRHHADALLQRGFGGRPVTTRRGQDEHVGLSQRLRGQRVPPAHLGADPIRDRQRLDQVGQPAGVVVHDGQLVQPVGSRQLPGGPAAHRADADQDGPH